MEKSTKYILIGVGVLAVVGVGLYISAQMKRRREEQIPQQKDTLVDVASKTVDKLLGGEAAQQRLANRRVKQSTKQAKLLKKGKITIADLQSLQKV